MNEDKQAVQVHRPHELKISDRKNLSLTGVEEVIGCDEEVLTVKTVMGKLTISGSRLHIGSFNRGTGELKIDGSISELGYADAEPERQGLFKKLFR